MLLRFKRPGAGPFSAGAVGRANQAQLRLEDLEQRLLLSISQGMTYPAYITGDAPATTPLQQAQAAAIRDTQGPTLFGNNGPLAKIGPNLAEVYEEHKLFEAAGSDSTATPFVPSNSEIQVSGDNVYIDAIASGDVSTLGSSLTALGMTVSGTAAQIVSGWFPIDQLNNLPSASGLTSARPAYKPIIHAGLTDAQSDKGLHADTARTQSGFNGTGITVGVISDSFNTSGTGSAATDVASGDLPAAGVNVLADEPSGTDEGRGMAQIVHDIAPGAAIAFSSAGQNDTDMANSIKNLHTQAGAQVIVDDVSFLDEPFYQDGIISQAVNSVTAQGVAYFSAEGNEGTGYQAAFKASNETGPAGGKLQNFSSSGDAPLQPITIPVGAGDDFIFQWAQPFASLGGPGSQSQVNFYIVGADKTTILSVGGNQNDISGDALQVIQFFNDGTHHLGGSTAPDTQFYIGIELASGPAPTNLGWVEHGPSGGFSVDQYDTLSASAFGHPNAAGDIGVAAAAFFNTTAYGASSTILNDFSSEGGMPVVYDTSGNLLSRPVVRQSPAVTGVDGVDTTFFGSPGTFPQDSDNYPNFFGTSAAAPGVAAVAALMLQASGGPGHLTPAEIRTELQNSTTPVTGRADPFNPGSSTAIPTGINYYSGYGLVNAITAVGFATPVVNGPHAVDDSATTDQNTPVAIAVLANDTASTSAIDPTTVTVVNQPTNGSVVINPLTGVATYSPAANFVGTDRFTYTVKDVSGNVSNVATVTITVLFVAIPPIAVDDTAVTDENVPLPINVVSNDTPGSNPIARSSVSIATPPTNGTLQINQQTGVVTYTPNYNFFGTDSFQYTISDIHGVVSNVAKVTITVNFVDQPPIAENDLAVTQPGAPVTIDVLANDFGTQAPSTIVPSTLRIIQQPLNGTAQIVNNKIVYTPLAGFIGGDSFEYTVADNYSKASNPAIVAIRSGDGVSLSGFAYVDANGDGIKQTSEVGIPNVTLQLTKTNGNYKFTAFALTGADGAYHFVEGTNYVLPAGTYTIKEIQPGFFVPGVSTMGTPAAAGPNSNAQFQNITLAPDQQASGYNFGAQGLSAVFAAAYFNRRAFLSSTGPNFTGLNLMAGSNWISFDAGVQGTLSAFARFDPSQGSVTMTLFNSAMQSVATSTSLGGQAELSFSGQSAGPYFLQLTGTNPNVSVNAIAAGAPVVPPPAPTTQFHNTLDPQDVNDDGKVTALDALTIINDLNAGKSGPLAAINGLGSSLVDVNGDGQLTALDALSIINQLNAAASAGAGAAVVTAAVETPLTVTPATVAPAAVGSDAAATTDTSSVAFALAVAQSAQPTGAAAGPVNASAGGAAAGGTAATSPSNSTVPLSAAPTATPRSARPTSSGSQLANLIWTDEEPW